MKPVFQMQQGDVFSTAKLRKGFTELTKLYGQFGYIDFVAEPSFEPIPNSDKIDLTLTFDEGKQFFVRRIVLPGAGHFWSADPFEDEPQGYNALVIPRLLRFLETSL